jgi:4-coumarate--CoA ligase
MAHIAGLQGYFIHPFALGGTVFWMTKFDFPKFLAYNLQYKITFFFTVPPIYLGIANSPAVTDQFKNMHHALSGAAPMGPELTSRAEKKLGCTIAQIYGLSETTGGLTDQPWDDKDNTGSISDLMSNIKMRIVDDDECDVAEGKEGEFVVQGPTIMSGYWKNPEGTVATFTKDGAWFKTGDIGLRRDGKFYIIDRKKVGKHYEPHTGSCHVKTQSL